MNERKVVRFQLDNGEWRSKAYILNPDTNKYKEEVKDEYAGWYDKNKFESYIHYLMNIERVKPKENKTLFNRKINVSWGKLQPELATEEHEFATEAHKFTKQQLIDTLNNDNATKNIERLSKMSREEVESEYKSTNRLALSNKDDIENRVNNAFLKGEGLEDITINGQKYKGLLFDENSKQSKMLMDNGTFKAYYNKYLSCMKEVVSEASDTKEIDIDAICEKLSTKLEKPNFSKQGEINDFDYYGLMGGTQNIEVDFEVIPVLNSEYTVKTTMYINDWYGADADDINNHTDYKEVLENAGKTFLTPDPMDNLIISGIYYRAIKSKPKNYIPGLDDFFWLQHHYGCKPFPIQIIYKSEDKINLAN